MEAWQFTLSSTWDLYLSTRNLLSVKFNASHKFVEANSSIFSKEHPL